MSDIVNDYFRRFYPVGERTNETYRFEGGGRGGFRYYGDEKVDRIFPSIVCADGLTMSVQGHYGAYCYPNDDFSEDPYSQVEIMAAPKLDTLLEPFEREHNMVGEEMIYPGVPVAIVCQIIEKHGGLKS